MEPGWMEPGLDGPMFGPVYPGVESSNKYAPKTERVQVGLPK